MAHFEIKNLSFSYPASKNGSALKAINLSIERGEYIAVCGKSGSGKTTLLKHLKSVLSPHGNVEGEIYFEGKPLEESDLRQQSAKIGYVMQNPDNQIVTDKVWHELAFGLESLGIDQKTIRLRVAEMASYFGIQGWFHKNVTELSGGQKQLLNLASIMAMQPTALILDEPTSQLDPIAAADFLKTVRKINLELGTTVIITEHRLEDIFHAADRVVVMEKGSIIAADEPHKIGEFLKAENNWNQVCNTGLVYGALALLDSDSKEAAAVIERAMSSVPLSMKVYAPDGNYPEGYNYWGYGTSFNVMLIAALESALGSDGGLSAVEGFMSSARFMQYMAGTTGLAFNFSDARETTQSFPAMFWYASKLGDPSLLWNEKIFLTREDTHFTAEEERFLPIILIYGSRFDMKEVTPPVSKIWTGHGKVPVALIRTGWDKGEGFYVGIKGGTASANHAHMDAGSFVFEAQGVRWAQDLGMQEYYSLEKEGVRLWNGDQDGQRWDVFRYNNFVHNTLTVNGEKHQVKGAVPILATYTKDARLGASLDMTSLFGSNLKKATREVVLVKERYLQVTDQVQAAGQPASVRWTMVTSATPKLLDSHTIELTKEGKKLHVIIDSPSAAAFSVVDNVPSHSYDAPNPGSVRIVFDVDVKAGRKETLKVRLVPVVE